MDRTTWDRYTSPRASWEYDIVAPGYKCNLPDILSAIGRVQLRYADDFDTKRKAHVKKYFSKLSDLDYLKMPPDSEGNSWHLFLLRLDLSKLDCDRNAFAKELQEKGIGVSMHFIPLFHFTYYKELYPDFTAEHFPRAEEKYQETISIPLWPDMTDEMIDYVVETIKQTGEKHHV